MSMDELKEDLARNVAAAARLEGFSAVGKHLSLTLWPFLESLVEQVSEIDDAVGELVHQQEDYLQPETAGVFVALLEVSRALAAKVATGMPDDADAQGLVALHGQLATEVTELLESITLATDEDDEDDEDDGQTDVAEAALAGVPGGDDAQA